MKRLIIITLWPTSLTVEAQHDFGTYFFKIDSVYSILFSNHHQLTGRVSSIDNTFIRMTTGGKENVKIHYARIIDAKSGKHRFPYHPKGSTLEYLAGNDRFFYAKRDFNNFGRPEIGISAIYAAIYWTITYDRKFCTSRNENWRLHLRTGVVQVGTSESGEFQGIPLDISADGIRIQILATKISDRCSI